MNVLVSGHEVAQGIEVGLLALIELSAGQQAIHDSLSLI
jgi:hypothetical protein